MRANAPLKRLSSASNTAVAFGMTAARSQPATGSTPLKSLDARSVRLEPDHIDDLRFRVGHRCAIPVAELQCADLFAEAINGCGVLLVELADLRECFRIEATESAFGIQCTECIG